VILVPVCLADVSQEMLFVGKLLVADVALEVTWSVVLRRHVTPEVTAATRPLAAHWADEREALAVNELVVLRQIERALEDCAALCTTVDGLRIKFSPLIALEHTKRYADSLRQRQTSY